MTLTTSQRLSEQQILDELVQRIEDLVPTAGFYQQGKPVDFSLEDVIRYIRQTDGGNSIAVTADGMFIEFQFREDTGGTYKELGDDNGRIVLWELGLSLREQKPEIHKFVHDFSLFPSQS